MPTQTVARSERFALCDLLLEKGPDAPTLCAGWKTADLAAHLFVRERRPLSAPGIVFSPMAGLAKGAMDKALAKYGYAGLVHEVHKGPPALIRPLDATMNTLEYFVHHEDVRRAAEGWEPREDAPLDEAVWSAIRKGAKFVARHVKGIGLDLVRPDGERIAARKGTPVATVTGGPQEIALFLYGRGPAARVEIGGPDDARAALENANLGV